MLNKTSLYGTALQWTWKLQDSVVKVPRNGLKYVKWHALSKWFDTFLKSINLYKNTVGHWCSMKAMLDFYKSILNWEIIWSVVGQKKCLIMYFIAWRYTDVLPGSTYNVKIKIRKRSMAIGTLHSHNFGNHWERQDEPRQAVKAFQPSICVPSIASPSDKSRKKATTTTWWQYHWNQERLIYDV